MHIRKRIKSGGRAAAQVAERAYGRAPVLGEGGRSGPRRITRKGGGCKRAGSLANNKKSS